MLSNTIENYVHWKINPHVQKLWNQGRSLTFIGFFYFFIYWIKDRLQPGERDKQIGHGDHLTSNILTKE